MTAKLNLKPLTNGNESHKISDVEKYFTLWLNNLAVFYEERDKRYEEKFDSLDTTMVKDFAAAKEKVADAFAASEKAMTKSDASQKEYNSTHNDLTHKMEKQYAEMLPRTEARFMQDDINDLKLFKSNYVGVLEAKKENKGTTKWIIALITTIILSALSVIATIIIAYFKH